MSKRHSNPSDEDKGQSKKAMKMGVQKDLRLRNADGEKSFSPEEGEYLVYHPAREKGRPLASSGFTVFEEIDFPYDHSNNDLMSEMAHEMHTVFQGEFPDVLHAGIGVHLLRCCPTDEQIVDMDEEDEEFEIVAVGPVSDSDARTQAWQKYKNSKSGGPAIYVKDGNITMTGGVTALGKPFELTYVLPKFMD